MIFIAEIIHRVFQLLILVVVVQAVLSFFMDPYHPIRRTIDQLMSPLLSPIRRVVPPIANLDFSPVVLIILLQIVDSFLFRLLVSIR